MDGDCAVESREEILASLKARPETSILVVGGGIHGAAFARLAALNGISCVLVEKGDYASGTSSRSSKMLHGGLRYLENFDFAQVFEGIRAREDLFSTAPHLCRPEQFAIPVARRVGWERAKLGAGLTLYDRMGLHAERRHRFVRHDDPVVTDIVAAGAKLAGAFLYTDGLTDDARLVIENIVDARRRGARCINYLDVVEVTESRREGPRFDARCLDRISGGEIEIAADVVVNCAGPWAPFIGCQECESILASIRYSVGVHLLFDHPWTGPSLFLPIPGQRSRYYFVWPHPGGSMVGTTEREVDRAEFDPLPTTDEVEEILSRLARDIPQSGLDRSSLYYGFSGVRTLPLRGHTAGTARLSRRHIWRWTGGVLTLVGGKLTTANITVADGFKRVADRLGTNGAIRTLAGIPYPGAAPPEELAELTTCLRQQGLAEDAVARIVSRYGARARYLLNCAHRLEPITAHLTVGEVELAVQEEQAETLEDVLRRRTGIEYLPGAIEPAMEPTVAQLPGGAFGREAEIRAYRSRLQELRGRLGLPESLRIDTPRV